MNTKSVLLAEESMPEIIMTMNNEFRFAISDVITFNNFVGVPLNRQSEQSVKDGINDL